MRQLSVRNVRIGETVAPTPRCLSTDISIGRNAEHPDARWPASKPDRYAFSRGATYTANNAAVDSTPATTKAIINHTRCVTLSGTWIAMQATRLTPNQAKPVNPYNTRRRKLRLNCVTPHGGCAAPKLFPDCG